MSWLVVGVALFLAIHIFVSGTPLRGLIVERVGEKRYLMGFSVASVLFLGVTIVGYAKAPYVELWQAGAGLRWLALVVMPVACIFLVGAFTSPNPTLMGGEKMLEGLDPAKGFVKITRHPFLWAVTLWATVHLIVNGDTASLILFASLLVLALVGPGLIDSKRAESHISEWSAFESVTSNVPFVALATGRTTLTWEEIGWKPIVGGLALYVVLLLVHPFLIGGTLVPF